MFVKPNIYQAVRVSRKIVAFTEPNKAVYHLKGLRVIRGKTDEQFHICDSKVALNINFVNDYHIKYEDRSSLVEFLNKIKALDDRHC
jgi:GTP:adenosylcobinamide-phosphate guanylyltransferase